MTILNLWNRIPILHSTQRHFLGIGAWIRILVISNIYMFVLFPKILLGGPLESFDQKIQKPTRSKDPKDLHNLMTI